MNWLREIGRQIGNPYTRLGRIPSEVYGVLWSLLWGCFSFGAFQLGGWPAAFCVSLLGLGVTLRITAD